MRVRVTIGAVLLVGAAPPPRERLVLGDGIVATTVNGTPARIRLDPAAPVMPLFTTAFAERAGLRLTGRWGIGIGYSVGPTEIMSRTQVVRIDLGSGPAKRRIGWTRRPFAAVADGSVGPEALPEPVVRFRLGQMRRGERTVTFRAVRDRELLGLWGGFGATFAEVVVGGEPMRIRFDPHHPRTLATAGAALRLARLHDGVVAGGAVPTEIFFGVERPVRDLTLRRPLLLGPLSIAAMGVRTDDHGSAASIREQDAPRIGTDPAEVIVTARRKRDLRHDVVSLGADQLDRCSALVFDRTRRTISLTCA